MGGAKELYMQSHGERAYVSRNSDFGVIVTPVPK